MDPVAKPSDLPYQLAYDAHRGSSFVPEKRAAAAQEEYAHFVNAFHAELLGLAETDEQRAVVAVEIERFRANYLRFLSALLSAQSRIVSSMIAGPSNFPVARMQKRNATADKRRTEFLEWHEKARKAARRAVLDARNPGQVASADWAALKREIDHDLAVVSGIDSGSADWRGMTRSAFTTSVSGKLERLATKGSAALVTQALEYVRVQTAEWKKPFFAARNSVWTLATLATAAGEAPKPTGTEEIATGEGWRIVNDCDAERVRIYFDAIPAPELRERLKGSGWRWSPTAGAWQRQNTNAAIYSAQKIVGATEQRKPNRGELEADLFEALQAFEDGDETAEERVNAAQARIAA